MLRLRRFLMYCFSLLLCILFSHFNSPITNAASSCSDFYVIFARGSGQGLNDIDHQSFSSAIKDIFNRLDGLTYSYYQLGESNRYGTQYPAIGIEQPKIISGAILSGGQSFEFGQNIQAGMQELKNLYHRVSSSCPNTRFILAGYSQGAMVISQTLSKFNSRKIFYYASFGDPKLYLPEGFGLLPPACRNKNFSPYRQNVPDCYVEQGLLGGLHPYIKQSFNQKVGAWCNIADFICGSSIDPWGFTDATQSPNSSMLARIFNGHVSYSRFGAYREAAEIIYRKLIKEQKLSNLKLKPLKPKNKQHLVYYFQQNDLKMTKDQARILKSSLLEKQSPQDPNKNSLDLTTSQNTDDQPKDLHIMIPNLISYHEDSRIQLLINKIVNAAYQNNCKSVTFYSYGFFSQAEIDKYNLFHPQNSQPIKPIHLPKSPDKKEGIMIRLSLYTETLTPFRASSIIGSYMKEQSNINDINVPKLINSSIQNIIKYGLWEKNHKHLLFIVTPNYQETHTFDSPDSNQIKELNKLISQKLISVSFYNTNQILIPFEKKLSRKSIFLQHQSDEEIINNFYQPDTREQKNALEYKNTLEYILKPRFDSIHLNLSTYPKSKIQNKYLMSSPLLSSSSSNVLPRTRLARSPRRGIKNIEWNIIQNNKIQSINTVDKSIDIPVHSISHTQITVKENGKSNQDFDLYFLPEPERIQDTTLFPYRLIIIDDYIAGFTNQNHLSITDLNRNTDHQIKVISYSILGRKVSEKITKIPKINSRNVNQNRYTRNTDQPGQHVSPNPYNAKTTQAPLVPDCGAKYVSPLRQILYYTQYFY